MQVQHTAIVSVFRGSKMVGDRRTVQPGLHETVFQGLVEWQLEHTEYTVKVCVPRDASPAGIGGLGTVDLEKYLEWVETQYQSVADLPDFFTALPVAKTESQEKAPAQPASRPGLDKFRRRLQPSDNGTSKPEA